MTTKLTIKQSEAQEAAESLKIMLQKAEYKVFTNLIHVSQSGMTRRISCFIATAPGELVNIDWYMEKLNVAKRSKKGGLTVTGCGTDMGFAIVYDLSKILYCPDKYNHDSAYKLTHKWL